MSQLDTLDLKPDAPDGIRGEFRSIATRMPGIRICEHLPRLAQRSHLWALVRSLSHPHNDHITGHAVMLTGRNEIPPENWPSITAVAGALTRPCNNLPSAAILPQLLYPNTVPYRRQFAEFMGAQHDPWLINALPYDLNTVGDFPEYSFTYKVLGPALIKDLDYADRS